MSELKPCPFCGSEVQDDERGEKYPKKSPMGGWIIHCECCGASLSQFRKSGKDEISWNTRPIEDALTTRIAELEADNKKTFDLVRKLRMYCIWANWDNPDTEDEFNEFDVEVCKWLSKFMEREE